jgi:hypothetical protein
MLRLNEALRVAIEMANDFKWEPVDGELLIWAFPGFSDLVTMLYDA